MPPSRCRPAALHFALAGVAELPISVHTAPGGSHKGRSADLMVCLLEKSKVGTGGRQRMVSTCATSVCQHVCTFYVLRDRSANFYDIPPFDGLTRFGTMSYLVHEAVSLQLAVSLQ